MSFALKIIVASTVLVSAKVHAISDWSDGRTLVPSSRIVSTRKGSIRGLLLTGGDEKQFPPVELFLGVPYASPPIGMLRFMPPVTVPPWRSVKIADRYSPVCPQNFPDVRNETEALKHMPRGRLEALRRLEPLLQNQSEDCLYLNIFTPYSCKFRFFLTYNLTLR